MSRFRGNWATGQRRSLRRILVVGAGRAGVAAAEELRRQGFGGELLIMCDEPDAPYDRPSCSKGLLTGHKRPVDAKMPMSDDLSLQWLMGRRAAHLDPQRRVVTADTDEEFSYDGLVIATGARPVWPKDWPTKGESGLYTLHGMQDAWQLRKALQRAKKVVVVGGGLTGCEVACSVRKMARECVLINTQEHVMVKALGNVVGEHVTEEVIKDGVDLRSRRRVTGVERDRRRWVVLLDDGSEIDTDVVVATIGEKPDVKWLADSGFDISDGVLCDENLRVVGGEDVVACGTIARWPNLRYSSEPRRVGQWIMALEQGRAAASSLLGSDHPSRPAALVPRYWSEQFGLRIQVCGEVSADRDTEVTVERRKPGSRHVARNGLLVNYFKNGEQVGVAAVNMVKAFTGIARQILSAPAQLAEPPELAPPAPPRRAVESRMIAAAPASAPPPGRHTIDVPASAVRDLSYEPYAPARAGAPAELEPAYAAAGPPARRGLPPGRRHAPEYDEPGYGRRGPAGPDPRSDYGPDYDPGYDPEYAPSPQSGMGYGPPEYAAAGRHGGPPRGRRAAAEPAYESQFETGQLPAIREASRYGDREERRERYDEPTFGGVSRSPGYPAEPPRRAAREQLALEARPARRRRAELEPDYDHPAPRYADRPHSAPAYDAPPAYGEPAYGEPAYGEPPRSAPAYRPSRYREPEYQAPRHHEPEYREPEYRERGYRGRPDHEPDYEPAYAAARYGPEGGPVPGYGQPGPPRTQYGEPGYPAESGYAAVGHGAPGYGGPGYGVPGYAEPGYGGPGYGGPGYGPDDFADYGPPGQWNTAADWPVSPAVRPVSPPTGPVSPAPRPVSPAARSGRARDRFTSEFAAVR